MDDNVMQQIYFIDDYEVDDNGVKKNNGIRSHWWNNVIDNKVICDDVWHRLCPGIVLQQWPVRNLVWEI